jgi:tetratricopeptide (TPR) repeat protein
MYPRYFRVALPALALAVTVGWSQPFCQAAKPREKENKTDKTKEADAAYKRAQAAFENSEFDEAIKLFGEVLKIDAGYVEAYVSRGMAWNEKSEPDKAIKDFNEAIRVDLKFAPAFFNRGMSWSAKTEFDNAGKPGHLADVKVGDRVVIDVPEHGTNALLIKVGTAKK